jgi:mono/diheme cytochrome c family protein
VQPPFQFSGTQTELKMKLLCECVGIVVFCGLSAWIAMAALAQQQLPDTTKIEAGETVYNTYCAPCHGDQLVSTGQFPNLRRLTPPDRTKFDSTVRDGRNQMPPWRGVLTDEQIDQIWSYIRSIVDR